MIIPISINDLWAAAAQTIVRIATGRVLLITTPCFDGSFIEFNNDGNQIPAIERFPYYKQFDQFRIYHPANITGAPTITLNSQTNILIADDPSCLSDYPTPQASFLSGNISGNMSMLVPKGYDKLSFYNTFIAGGADFSMFSLTGRQIGSTVYSDKTLYQVVPLAGTYNNYQVEINVQRYAELALTRDTGTQILDFSFSFLKTL